MKKWFILFLAVLMLLLPGCGKEESPQTEESDQKLAIRILTDYRQDSIGYRQLEEFAQLLKEKSDNTVVVKLYRRGEWGPAASFADYLNVDNVEMVCLQPLQMNALQPAYEIFMQPYLFSDLNEVESYVTGKDGKKAMRYLPAKYQGIGFVTDGYPYLVSGEEGGWLSFGDLKWRGQTKSLEGIPVYDMKAVHNLSILTATTEWWQARSDEEREWIEESLKESQKASFAQQRGKDYKKNLVSLGIMLQGSDQPEWNSYYTSLLNQRETYFSAHVDKLTQHWRPAAEIPPATEEEDEKE